MFILSIVSGVLIILSAVFLLRKEFLKAVKQQNIYLEQAKVFEKENLSDLLLDMQKSIDDMNQAFYDIANDLEGKYSLHEKEITDVLKDVRHLDEGVRILSKGLERLSDQVQQLSDALEQGPNVNVEEASIPFEKSLNLDTGINPVEKTLDSISMVIEDKKMEPENTSYELEPEPEPEPECLIEPIETRVEDLEVINKILSLSKMGFDRKQIAKELGLGLGALELIIKLNALDL